MTARPAQPVFDSSPHMAVRAMIGPPLIFSSSFREFCEVRAMVMPDFASMAGDQRRRRLNDGGGSVEYGAGGVIDGGSGAIEGDLRDWAPWAACTSRLWAEYATIVCAADAHRVGCHRNGNVWLTGKPVFGKRCQTSHESRVSRKARSNIGVATSGREFLRSVWRL